MNAVIAIRRYQKRNPDIDLDDAISLLANSDSDMAAYDFYAALAVIKQLPNDVDFTDIKIDMRRAIETLIINNDPWWLRNFPYGRERVAFSLSNDERQCLRSAGLFDSPPDVETVEWWDRLADKARARLNGQLLAQGREAERLSFEHEMLRLKELRIDKPPKWISVEDNTAGYDIQSYSCGEFGPINLLIEVKSSLKNPAIIFITKNEWQTAIQYGSSYVFHLWNMEKMILRVMGVADIERHIPANQGRGEWESVAIEIT